MARGILPGRIKMRWLTSAPTFAAPTQTQLNAGVDLVGSSQDEELAEIEGFMVESDTIPTPGFASNRVGNVGGDQTYPNSRLAFYKDSAVTDIYDALEDGNTGWVVIMLDGQGNGKESETFPATVLSRVRRKVRDEAGIFDVNFSIGVPVPGTQAA